MFNHAVYIFSSSFIMDKKCVESDVLNDVSTYALETIVYSCKITGDF